MTTFGETLPPLVIQKGLMEQVPQYLDLQVARVALYEVINAHSIAVALMDNHSNTSGTSGTFSFSSSGPQSHAWAPNDSTAAKLLLPISLDSPAHSGDFLQGSLPFTVSLLGLSPSRDPSSGDVVTLIGKGVARLSHVTGLTEKGTIFDVELLRDVHANNPAAQQRWMTVGVVNIFASWSAAASKPQGPSPQPPNVLHDRVGAAAGLATPSVLRKLQSPGVYRRVRRRVNQQQLVEGHTAATSIADFRLRLLTQQEKARRAVRGKAPLVLLESIYQQTARDQTSLRVPFGASAVLTNRQPSAADGAFGATSAKPSAADGAFGATSAKPSAADGAFGATSAKPSAADGAFGATSAKPSAADGAFGATSAKPSAHPDAARYLEGHPLVMVDDGPDKTFLKYAEYAGAANTTAAPMASSAAEVERELEELLREAVLANHSAQGSELFGKDSPGRGLGNSLFGSDLGFINQMVQPLPETLVDVEKEIATVERDLAVIQSYIPPSRMEQDILNRIAAEQQSVYELTAQIEGTSYEFSRLHAAYFDINEMENMTSIVELRLLESEIVSLSKTLAHSSRSLREVTGGVLESFPPDPDELTLKNPNDLGHLDEILRLEMEIIDISMAFEQKKEAIAAAIENYDLMVPAEQRAADEEAALLEEMCELHVFELSERAHRLRTAVVSRLMSSPSIRKLMLQGAGLSGYASTSTRLVPTDLHTNDMKRITGPAETSSEEPVELAEAPAVSKSWGRQRTQKQLRLLNRTPNGPAPLPVRSSNVAGQEQQDRSPISKAYKELLQLTEQHAALVPPTVDTCVKLSTARKKHIMPTDPSAPSTPLRSGGPVEPPETPLPPLPHEETKDLVAFAASIALPEPEEGEDVSDAVPSTPAQEDALDPDLPPAEEVPTAEAIVEIVPGGLAMSEGIWLESPAQYFANEQRMAELQRTLQGNSKDMSASEFNSLPMTIVEAQQQRQTLKIPGLRSTHPRLNYSTVHRIKDPNRRPPAHALALGKPRFLAVSSHGGVVPQAEASVIDESYIEVIVNCQRYVRGFLARRRRDHMQLVRGVVRIQSVWRGFLARNPYRSEWREAVSEDPTLPFFAPAFDVSVSHRPGYGDHDAKQPRAVRLAPALDLSLVFPDEEQCAMEHHVHTALLLVTKRWKMFTLAAQAKRLVQRLKLEAAAAKIQKVWRTYIACRECKMHLWRRLIVVRGNPQALLHMATRTPLPDDARDLESESSSSTSSSESDSSEEDDAILPDDLSSEWTTYDQSRPLTALKSQPTLAVPDHTVQLGWPTPERAGYDDAEPDDRERTDVEVM